ncbi:hypothetical protein [Enterobacter ludwigii]|uniref:hypothetical protein n=1 Tax=Enterobacter ludwigii TaxID=299767 RepID=UPI00046D8741|nr:hypothetical protein [Enterobacter ludwigii]
MKIYSVIIGKDHFCLESKTGNDFWITLGDGQGWGRFAMFRPIQEQHPGRALFRLVEILPPEANPPVAVVDTGNIFQLSQQIREYLGKEMRLQPEKMLSLNVSEG